jgi:hypothetical protein
VKRLLVVMSLIALAWAALFAGGYGIYRLYDWGVHHVGWWFPAAVFCAFGFIVSVYFAWSEWE